MRKRNIARTTAEKLDVMDTWFRAFPNLEATQGSYGYFSQTVRADGFDVAAFDRAFRDRDPATRLKLLPLLAHELQHSDDHLMSVWGAENLRRLFTAMNGRVSTDMSCLGDLTTVFRGVRDVHLGEYYSEVYHGADLPWDGRT